MRNLAGNRDCDKHIRSELERCGIQALTVPAANSEVPYTVMGELKCNGFEFEFRRAWTYWCVEGNLPLAIAEQLYKDPVGVRDIRVAGHCGCPPPAEWISWTRPDGRLVVPTKEEPEFRRLALKGMLTKEYADALFSDDPASLGYKPYISSYHIDSELGLYIFVQTLNRELPKIGDSK